MSTIYFKKQADDWVYQVEHDNGLISDNQDVGKDVVYTYLGISNSAKLSYSCHNIVGSEGEPDLKLRIRVEHGRIIRATMAVSDHTPLSGGMELGAFQLEFDHT